MSSIIQYRASIFFQKPYPDVNKTSGMVQRPGGSDRYNAGTSRGEQKNEEKKELVSQESTTSSIGHIAADPSYYTATGRQSKPYSSASAFSNPCKKRVSTSSLQPPESQNLVDKDLLVDQQQCSTHSVYGRQDQARGEQQRQQQQQQEMVEVSIERLRQYHTGTNKCRYHGYATKRLPYGNLGKSGLRVSSIGLGTWVTFGSQISEEVAEEMVTLAYESGINFFDTAEVYAGGKAEVILGNIFKNKGWRRSSYIISTKLYVGGKAETEKGLSRKHIIEGLQASLSRLQMQYVDLVFANKPDPHTPMEEIVRAFTHVINLGWAMYWGTSRWSPMEIMEAYSVARQFNLIPPIAEQAEYNLFQREKVEIQMPELFQKIGLGCITWSPMACGALTGKYEDGVPPQSRAALKGYNWLKDKILSEEGRRHQQKLRELTPLAERLGCTLAQLAIAWCLKNDNVHCVLLGATTVDQLYENLQSLQVVPKLNILYMNEIDRILGNKPVAHGLSNQR